MFPPALNCTALQLSLDLAGAPEHTGEWPLLEEVVTDEHMRSSVVHLDLNADLPNEETQQVRP